VEFVGSATSNPPSSRESYRPLLFLFTHNFLILMAKVIDNYDNSKLNFMKNRCGQRKNITKHLFF